MRLIVLEVILHMNGEVEKKPIQVHRLGTINPEAGTCEINNFGWHLGKYTDNRAIVSCRRISGRE